MEDFQLAKTIRNYLLNRVGQIIEYNWSDDFKIKELNNFESEIKSLDGFEYINLENINYSQLQSLGFKLWDEESKLMLMPLWITRYISPKTKLISISGEESNDINSVDKDVRFGCIAWGIVDYKFSNEI